MDEMKEQLRKKFTEPRAEIVRLKGCVALRTSDSGDCSTYTDESGDDSNEIDQINKINQICENVW